jgi:hypothetical protein
MLNDFGSQFLETVSGKLGCSPDCFRTQARPLSHLLDWLTWRPQNPVNMVVSEAWWIAKKLSRFGDDFFGHLLAIYKEPDIDIIFAYGLARSCWHGVTTQATNVGISPTAIDWIHCLNTAEKEVINQKLSVIYVEQKQMLQSFLGFSVAL